VTDTFTFKYRAETDASGRLNAAVVRYDGDAGTLSRAASHVGVTASPFKADKNGNPRIRLTGRNVQSAIEQYASRAYSRGQYVLGDV
jgi:hypothetical protein